LHTIAEIESGVFLMEGLELGRRWMWVFLRIEWCVSLFSTLVFHDPWSDCSRKEADILFFLVVL
jgi:hypothetical protein